MSDRGCARTRYGRGVSAAALAMATLYAVPVVAAPVTLGQILGATGSSTVNPSVVASPRAITLQQVLDRSTGAMGTQTRAAAIRDYVGQAQAAALAAAHTQPKDGLDPNGLDPVKDAVAAALDAVGNKTWQGASGPVQTTDGTNYTVTITQTDPRALLSWNRFDVGSKTTLNFDQKLGGVAQPGWVVVNRVVDSVAPSTILGKITGDGTAVILNSRGVIFGKGSQVNLHSLLVSTLEIGNAIRYVNGSTVPVTTLAERNQAYLGNGLFASAPNTQLPNQFLSAVADSSVDQATLLSQQTYAPVAQVEGDITIDAGASITSTNGGFLMFAGPSITNAGSLIADGGQVSLQAGRAITATTSAGDAQSADPEVRGIILRTAATAGGEVINQGLIQANRGYVSLGAGQQGVVTNAGLIASTTSVSRNGKISLTGGTILLTGSGDPAHASGIVITPDTSSETIPQGTASEPANFVTSSIDIGNVIYDSNNAYSTLGSVGSIVGKLGPANFTMAQNSLIFAPSANVRIGENRTNPYDFAAPLTKVAVSIEAGAAIDVSGVKGVAVDASRNSIVISPVKRNELRDTPNYREPTTDGSFTLNGTTLYIDPRQSGVRADGVAWVGSPLVDAAPVVGQIPVSSAELMTKGGNINIGVTRSTNVLLTPDQLSTIDIAAGSLLDVSGGWVHYNAGTVRTSKLLTSDGRIVDISQADPNDSFVAVGDGFTDVQAAFGVSRTYANSVLQGSHAEAAYDEGRDAGSLVIASPAARLEGSIYGQVFAGAQQIGKSKQGSAVSTIVGDPRKLQASKYELPSGGFVSIGSQAGTTITPGADIIVYHGTLGATRTSFSEILLSDTMLNNAGLGALSLQSSGAVTFANAGTPNLQAPGALTLTGDSNLTLTPGGILSVAAGRSIRFDGTVSAPGGTINAATYQLGAVGDYRLNGSAFRTDDDIPLQYAAGSVAPSPFDIIVTGKLSAAGRWVNDIGKGTDFIDGSAWTSGGSITLRVAPRVLVPVAGSGAQGNDVLDLSGSIAVNAGAKVDLTSGGYLASNGAPMLSARGGNLSLIDETTYARVSLTTRNDAQNYIDPLTGSGPTVPVTSNSNVGSLLVPSHPSSTVTVASGTVSAFGFGGGGTLAIVTPEAAFADTGPVTSTLLPLDILQQTGFGTLDVTVNHSRLLPGVFTNGVAGTAAFFDTTTMRVGSGETFSLDQAIYSPLLTATQTFALSKLATGGSVGSVLTPAVALDPYDKLPASLVLRGLTELVVDAGGQITGAPGASLTIPKLLNSGTITLRGGSITQRAALPFGQRISAVTDTVAGSSDGLSEIFGGPRVNGRFLENAATNASLGLTGPDGTTPLSNYDALTLFGFDRNIYFLGSVGATDGIVLAGGSLTDLSGIALINPRAPLIRDAGGVLRQQVTGRILNGGTLSTAASLQSNAAFFSVPDFGVNRYVVPGTDQALPQFVAAGALIGDAGSTLDLRGTTATFDELTSTKGFTSVLEWSNGGTLSVLGGGHISGATVLAQGGTASATGGTIEWLNPLLYQSTAEADAGGGLSADQIEASGFDSFVARRSITAGGDVSLSLRKSFRLESGPLTTDFRTIADLRTRVDAVADVGGAGVDATIAAPYIRIASDGQTAGLPGDGIPGHSTFTFDASVLDIAGGVTLASNLAATNFNATGDLRLIGVGPIPLANITPLTLNGQILAAGDINLSAAQVYTTTGTGNLQLLIEDRLAGRATTATPYLIGSTGANSTIRFSRSANAAATAMPLSAGSWLQVQAANIVQDGQLRAPFGRVDIGGTAPTLIAGTNVSLPATKTVSFGDGSITSVSGAGLNVPYGTTTDQIEYFFSPIVSGALTTVPTGELRLGGDKLDIQSGAVVDGSGGGSLFAYEFISGTGGSRDVLSRINNDLSSGNSFTRDASGNLIGYQYADARQVYAIVPVSGAAAAKFDPLYSADYTTAAGGDLYGANIGRTVHLDAAPGIAAGEYLLLPAQYAATAGGLRLVENVGISAPPVDGSTRLLDGSVIVGGVYGTAGTSLVDSQRHSFTVETTATVLKYSRIGLTDGQTSLNTAAAKAGFVSTRQLIDAARVIISPLTSLRNAGLFDTQGAAGGRGAQIDVTGTNILISNADTAPAGTVLLSPAALTALNAASLSIGALRTDAADGTTALSVAAKSIVVDTGVTLTAPELLLAVGGENSLLSVKDGATLAAGGTLADPRTGDYIIASGTTVPAGFDQSGVGAVLRVADGPERLVKRTGTQTTADTLLPTTLAVGKATLSGTSVLIDTTRSFSISDDVTLAATNMALSGDFVRFGRALSAKDQFISAALEAKLAAAPHLTLRSPDVVTFSAGTHNFNDLRIDSGGIGITVPARTTLNSPTAVTINAGIVTLGNTSADLGKCTGAGTLFCGSTGNSLTLNAREVDFTGGQVRTYGFDKSVALGAAQGLYVDGVGGFQTQAAALSITTPFIADRSPIVDPRLQRIQTSFAIDTDGTVAITAPAGTLVAPTGDPGVGARILVGSLAAPVKSIAIDGALIRATAGSISLFSDGDIALTNGASLSTPGYTKTFGNAAASTTVSADGGAIVVQSNTGGITFDVGTSLVSDTGVGSAGSIALLASRGAITNNAVFNPGVAVGAVRGASLTIDSGKSAFDFGQFVSTYGTRFGGDLNVRAGIGDMALAAGQVFKAKSVSLTTESGAITIGGKIDTSAAEGGAISLYGNDGVTLSSGAVLDAHADGYADTDTRRATAGHVTLEIGTDIATLTLASGSTIDVGARRKDNRVIGTAASDPITLNPTTDYRFVEADSGGTVTLRAPAIGDGATQTVGITTGGTITGAATTEIEGFRRFDLDAIMASKQYAGVLRDADGGIHLSATASAKGKVNFLAATTGPVVSFVQDLNLAARDGSSLAGYTQRPGLEFDAVGNIVLDSNWNLGAGTINDIPGAIAKGYLQLSPLGPYANKTARYEVVPGMEGALFREFVSLTYRVGGKVDGAPGIVSFRAGGTLDIKNSITDGFFSFGDSTDPDYISYQLGGGDRVYRPALSFNCGAYNGDCTSLPDFSLDLIGLPRAEAASITPTRTVAGDDISPFASAPYSSAANSPGALGLGAGGAGDPLGTAVLFPLLGDGSAVESTSFRLIGGAGSQSSVNPLTVDHGSTGAVIVEGEKSYTVEAVAGKARYGGDLQLRYAGASNTGLDPYSYGIDDLIAELDASGQIQTGALAGLNSTTLVTLSLRTSGQRSQKDLKKAALAFFPKEQFSPQSSLGSNNPNAQLTVAAPLSQMLAFFKSVGPTFAANIESHLYGPQSPTAVTPKQYSQKTAYVRTIVRTGTGSIDVAAAGNVDLRGSQNPVFRTDKGATTRSGTQIGGTAVYTAGHIVVPTEMTARIAGTSQFTTVTPDAFAFSAGGQDKYNPQTKARFPIAATYASGGGSLNMVAGGDVLGRRDYWAEQFLSQAGVIGGSSSAVTLDPAGAIGAPQQLWRYGGVNEDIDGNGSVETEIGILPNFFTSGVGALAGGNVTITAGGQVSDLQVALDTTVASAHEASGAPALITYGSGSLSLTSGGNIDAARLDVASGTENVRAGGGIGAFANANNLPTLRMTDTVANISAGGSIRINGVSALGAGKPDRNLSITQQGFYAPDSKLSVQANGGIDLSGGTALTVLSDGILNTDFNVGLLPASLDIRALGGSFTLNTVIGNQTGRINLTTPGPQSSISVLVSGDLGPIWLSQGDADPAYFPGAFSSPAGDVNSGVESPVSGPLTSDKTLRRLHNRQTTHGNDYTPNLILVDGSIRGSVFTFAEAANVFAGGDIIDTNFVGQNVRSSDVTQIVAGRDLTSSVRVNDSGLSFNVGNDIVIGGPGTLLVEAGRNLGPFVTSANTNIAGGIRTVGNDLNPWLGTDGANIDVLFGIANGIAYSSLRDTYLDPANLAMLDGDLFAQNTDSSGNKSPDRSRPIYAPILAQWLLDNEPAAAAAILGNTSFASPDALAAAAYPKFDALYQAFLAIDGTRQNQFLLDKVYFNELKAPADPGGNSYLQYIRGYRAVAALFPASLGYTDNLATYYTDPASISVDHPLGEARKILANPLTGAALFGSDGKPLTDLSLAPIFIDPVTGRTLGAVPLRATQIVTGNADLRLSTIETARGGDINLIGPGGNFIEGSTVRTSEQLRRKATSRLFRNLVRNGAPISNIPIGYEGVLTLRGGAIRSFTDGNFQVNQSRVYTVNGINFGGRQLPGDITMWSSNGDLNAGQGPKSSSNFPRVTVRFDPNGLSEVNSAGSVSGAGIAALQTSLTTAAPDVTLIAPVGEVDAGDAGVRASGNIFVAAARVANADNFKAGGTTVGVPSGAVVAAPAIPASAASAIASTIAGANNSTRSLGDRLSRIIVEVLGYAGGTKDCDDPKNANDQDCQQQQ